VDCCVLVAAVEMPPQSNITADSPFLWAAYSGNWGGPIHADILNVTCLLNYRECHETLPFPFSGSSVLEVGMAAFSSPCCFWSCQRLCVVVCVVHVAAGMQRLYVGMAIGKECWYSLACFMVCMARPESTQCCSGDFSPWGRDRCGKCAAAKNVGSVTSVHRSLARPSCQDGSMLTPT
jgi:hypothetical protein